MLFHGVMTALVTPFQNGAFDEKSYRNLIELQIQSGIHGLIPLGTTGESPCVSYEEHFRIVSVCVDQAKGRVPVIAGAGSNSTQNALKLTEQAKKAGADAALHVTPYYNKPTQEGLFLHYKTIAESVDLPVFLYNVPSRTSVTMTAETTLRLAQIKNIAGTKETADMARIEAILKERPKCFLVLSGDDPMNTDVYDRGGNGAISVVSNVIPETASKIWNLHQKGDRANAADLQETLKELHQILFIETNPIPVKTALHLMGKCTEEFRLPLCKMGDKNREELKRILKNYKLI